MEKEHPRTGIGVMAFKDGKVLLGKRKNAHGAGEYSFPGGHLEYMESFIDCAKRETLEECGVEVENVRFQFLANLKDYAPKHYTHIGLVADWKSGEPQTLEPEKCEGWAWYDLGSLPTPLFSTCVLALEAHRTGHNFYD